MRRAPLALVALLAAACERSAVPAPCDGDVQGRFRLTAAPAVTGDAAADEANAACAARLRLSAAPAPAVTVSFLGDASAAVCAERALAAPLEGTRAGDAIDVAAPVASASVPGCACAATVVERLAGAVARDATGAAVSFEGVLENSLALADPAGCAAADLAACAPLPCVARWTVSGGR